MYVFKFVLFFSEGHVLKKKNQPAAKGLVCFVSVSPSHTFPTPEQEQGRF